MTYLVRGPRLLSLLLAAASLCACAGLPPVPAHGGPRWFRLESEHFVLHSDLSQASARDRILLFERLLDAYYQLGWEARGKLPVKLHVVVFSDSSDFELFAGDTVGFHVAVPLFEPLVVMPDAGRIESWQTLKHELTHYIAFQSLPLQPQWFAEGLAVYFQTAYFDSQERFVVGEVPRSYHALLAERRMSARELFAADWREPSASFYASSWLLVHCLMSERGEPFAKYQSMLADTHSPSEAWAAAFPDLPVEKVDQVISHYFKAGEYPYFRRVVRAYVAPEPEVSELSNADVYALRAQLYLNCPACADEEQRLALESIDQALRLDTWHVRASAIRYSFMPPAERLAFAQALVRAHPEAWLAWAMVARAELVGASHRCTSEVSARLHDLGATSARALMFAATCQAAAGARQEALDLSARALRRQPADTVMLSMQAAVFQAVGECAALQGLLPRLRESVHSKVSPETLEGLAECHAPQ
jgi:hypothetical protein